MLDKLRTKIKQVVESLKTRLKLKTKQSVEEEY